MIDLHSHILPGIDDGARSLDIALEMARQAVDNGITHMVCTPHMHKGYFDNTYASIESTFKTFEKNVALHNIPITLSFAAEIRVNELIPIWHQQNELPFLGALDNKRILLLEMPHSHLPQGLDLLVKWLLKNNIQPLIAHPERNRELLNEQHKFLWLQRLGCKFQATAGALTGRFGENIQHFATTLLRERAFHVVASDTHDTLRRPNDMKEAFDLVSKFDEDYADQLFVKTPGAIVSSAKQ